MPIRLVALLASLLVVASLAGCSSAATTAPSAAAPTVSDAWVRPPMGSGQPAGGYMIITNPGGQADALVGVSSPVATSVEIHETTTDASGMTGMHPVDRLDVPAGGSVTLQPGGYHLMLMGVTQPLAVGTTVELDLVFEYAGDVTIQAEVRQG